MKVFSAITPLKILVAREPAATLKDISRLIEEKRNGEVWKEAGVKGW